MIRGQKMTKFIVKLTAVLILSLFILGPQTVTSVFSDQFSGSDNQNLEISELMAAIAAQREEEDPVYYDSEPGVNDEFIPEDYDITKYLMNNEMAYQKVWEPWLTKAAVRCIATDPSQEFIAVGGGYLYDNEIHIYRWNEYSREYDKVWDSGDMIIQGDVISLDFGDTDNNDFMEIVAGSADGHVYVFEQEHIYDPFDNMENQFVHVWTSPMIQQVWGVKIADVDKDYIPDIIAGSWDGKVHVYEYTNHSGYPFTDEHWIEYTEKTTIDVGEKIFSIATGDTNYNALPEIIVGTETGRVYIYENNGTILSINGKPWPLTQDNSYRYHWDSGNITWKPVTKIIVDSLDDDNPDEIVYISQGQNVFVVNFDESIGSSGAYLTHQLWEPLDSWELGGLEGLGHFLNHYIDWMTWSNNNASKTSDTSDDLLVYNDQGHGDAITLEPAIGWAAPQYPKNTSMAIDKKLSPYDKNYTTFDATSYPIASAIVDWGNDGEVMGDGLMAIPEEDLGYDIYMRFANTTSPTGTLDDLSIEVSPTGGEWALIPNEDISTALVNVVNPADDDLLIDLDPTLSDRHWAYIRYMRINVTNGGYYKIDGAYSPVLYRPVDTATSITIGNLDLDYYKAYTSGESEGKKIVLGTADGKIIMFEYNSGTKAYDLLWNSYKNDSYTQGTNIWDIVEVKSPGKIPTWLYNESKSTVFDFKETENKILEVQLFSYGILPLGPPYEGMTIQELVDAGQLDEEFLYLKISELIEGAFLPPVFWQFSIDFSSVAHVSLFSSFFEAIFDLPAFAPFKDIIELKIPSNDMVVGTTNGDLVVIPELTHVESDLGNFFFFMVNNNPFYDGKAISPTFVDFNKDANYFPEIMLLGWADTNQFYDPAIEGSKASAGLDFYTYDAIAPPLGTYAGKFELSQVEITGLLARALEKSQRMPETAVGDVDGDGDMDIVLTNGRVYLIENIENTLFVLDPEYFQDLNTKATDRLFNSPQLYDFDQDGDLDLTVGWENRKGTIVSTTYYENVGYTWAPEWVENKWLYTNSWGGLRFNTLTSAAFALNDQTGRIDYITTYNTTGDQLVRLDAEYDNHNAFVIGTNPKIARLEINLKSGTDSHGNPIANYGYHVFETWNTKADLEQWTLSINTGDMDQDGRGEVIVGDFDNNLYVFEHLTNNTYKRAYRGQDLTHEELSLTSPYAYEQLEGISGTFYRTIWDHVEEIIVGLDMDNDGFLEMVATAGLSIFVWEQRNDGFVSVDDEYTLIWQCDLRQSAWAPLFADLGVTKFTAAAYGGDLDYNGFGEFVLAAGSFLFVFESNGANQFYENFLVNPFPVRGRYFMPGNPFTSKAVRVLSIESIVIADTDNDTLNEIIIAGVNKTWWGEYNGFVCILENQIGTYAYTWWAPREYMEDNPVYDVMVDNQDYDRFKEILVGSFKGVVIYENYEFGGTRDNLYIQRSVLTSFVNFPKMKLEQMFALQAKLPLALRNTDLLELQVDYDSQLPKSYWIQIFKAGPFLVWAISDDYGKEESWTQMGRVVTSKIVVGGRSSYEYHPSIYQTKDGNIWLAIAAGMAGKKGIWLLKLAGSAGTYYWENAGTDIAIDGTYLNPTNDFLYNPSVWDFHNNTVEGVAISYMSSFDGGIYWLGDPFENATDDYYGRIPLIGKNPADNKAEWENEYNRTGYLAVSHDAIRSTSGKVVLVFTGMKYDEAKIDLDLWIAKANSTPIWNPRYGYSRATIEAIDELQPSITQTVTNDHALMIIFEADGDHPSGALQVTYSKDDGESWREPEPVTTTPPFAEYISYPEYGFSLMVLKGYPNIIIKSLIAVGPSITAHWEGGFAYSFMSEYSFYALPSLGKGRSSSLKTLNQGYAASMGDTQQLSTGDISAHSGLVKNVGGGMTTGGGKISYQGTPIGQLVNISDGGGGSALYYAATSPKVPKVTYTAPVVTGEAKISGYGGSVMAYTGDAEGTDDPGSDQNTGSGYTGGGSLLAANFNGMDFHVTDLTPDLGWFRNIFFGMNPSSNFTLFDFKEARAISTGDSDKDFRREIAIASGNQAYLVEVSRTGGSTSYQDQVLFYYQSWHSDGLATETTDIELYDANGNGMDEIIVSCTQGNVYSFEGMNTNPPPTNYLFLDGIEPNGRITPLWQNNSYFGNIQTLDPKPKVLVDTTDIGDDGVDDVFVASMDQPGTGYGGYPLIRALNGSSGDAFWTFNLSTAQNALSKDSAILWLKSAKLDTDNITDVIFLAYDFSSGVVWLYGLVASSSSATEKWASISFAGVDATKINDLTLTTFDNDSVDDIFLAIENTTYYVNGNTGIKTVFHSFSPSINSNHISIGNNTMVLSGRESDSDEGEIAWVHFNGTVLYTFDRNNSRFGLTSTLNDVNDDGIEDILILESGVLFAHDTTVNISDQLWNNTLNGGIGNLPDTLKYDFNGDKYEDILIQVKYNQHVSNPTKTVKFEDLGHYESFAEDRYSGLNFTGGTGWTGYNWTTGGISWGGTRSGDLCVYNGATDSKIIIQEMASRVSAFFWTASGYSYNFVAYDYRGNKIDSSFIEGNRKRQYVEVNDPLGMIYEVRIELVTGIAGASYLMDDLAYHRQPQTKILVLSGLNPQEILWEYHLWDTHAIQFSQGDLDRDGEPDDLLFITENTGYPHTGTINAIDGKYGTPLVNYQAYSEYGLMTSVAAGNFGEFGEAAFVNDYGYVLMTTFVRHEPTYYQEVAIQTKGMATFKTRGIVTDIAVGDFNADGVDDVIFGDNKRYIIALDGFTGDMIWKYRTSQPISQIAVHDFHLQDGYSDIAVVLQSGMLVIINGETGRPLWKDYLGPVIVNEMEFADINNDGITEELAISMGFRFLPNVGLFEVYNVTKNSTTGTGELFWASLNPLGAYTQFEVVELGTDGVKDIVVAIHDHSIWMINGSLGTQPGLKWFFNAIPIEVQDFKIGNFTGESLPQIAAIVRNGTVVIYHSSDWTDWALNTIAAKIHLDIPLRLSHLEIGQFTGSGEGPDELVIRSFGDASYCLYYYTNNLHQDWRFEDRSIFYLDEYEVADLNNDSKLDILSLNYDNIFALDGDKGEVIWASFVPTNLIRSMTTGDFNDDNITDVVVGTADRMIYIIYGKEEQLVLQTEDRKAKIASIDETPSIPQVAPVQDEKRATTIKIPFSLFILVATTLILPIIGGKFKR